MLTKNGENSVAKQSGLGLLWWSSGQDCAHNAGAPGSTPGQRAASHTPQQRAHMAATKSSRAAMRSSKNECVPKTPK